MVKYITDYEVSALLFLLVITIRFFSIRKFPSKLNSLFGIILHCAMADIALDLLGSYTIANIDKIGITINYAVNTAFYCFQVVLPLLVLIYLLTMCNFEDTRLRYLWYIPAAACFAALAINPFTNIIFYFEHTESEILFCHGSLFPALYSVSVFYLTMTLVCAIRHRKKLKKSEVMTIVSFVIIIVTAIGIQMIAPQLLLTGIAVAIAILMMFFTIQNPETMLDVVSGVFNFNALHDFLQIKTAEKEPVLLTAIDIGGIRRINSAYGLRAGNDVLRQAGNFFNDICRDGSMAFQIIGTKFLIVSELADTHREIVDKVGRRFNRPWIYGGVEISLIATIRYSVSKNVFNTPEDVINLIDLAYAGLSGTDFGSVRPLSEELIEQSRRRTQVEEALRRALDSGKGFSLHYQPIYSVRNECFCSAEALLRLTDPELGDISPAEFIPVAEAMGYISRIDSLVIDMASKFLRSHPELSSTGFRLLEINLSAAEFYSDADLLAENILSKLADFKHMVCFEVTETAATTHREILSGFMEKLIDNGIIFAIDDFGTGFANITQLAKLPFSIAKIDRGFFTSERQKERMILEDVVRMFDRIGLETVIEGPETQEQSQFAAELGASEIQGYFYSRPLPENDFLVFLLDNACA